MSSLRRVLTIFFCPHPLFAQQFCTVNAFNGYFLSYNTLYYTKCNLILNKIMSISPTNRGRIYFSEPAKVFQGSNRPWTKLREAWMIEHKINLTTNPWELGIKIILKFYFGVDGVLKNLFCFDQDKICRFDIMPFQR